MPVNYENGHRIVEAEHDSSGHRCDDRSSASISTSSRLAGITECGKDQRDWANNITTVDGQDSVYHCFYVTGDATIDGFTITGGTALFSYPHGRGGGMHIFNSSATIANCILWGNPAQSVQEIYKGVSSYPTVIFCNVNQDGYAGSNGNIREDPLFVDPENGDFHLKASSPCIDAGTNDAPGLPATDFDGEERLFDVDNDGTATLDIGLRATLLTIVPTLCLLVLSRV